MPLLDLKDLRAMVRQVGDALGGLMSGSRPRAGSRGRQTMVEAAMSSTLRAIGSSLGRQIARGILGSIMGGRAK